MSAHSLFSTRVPQRQKLDSLKIILRSSRSLPTQNPLHTFSKTKTHTMSLQRRLTCVIRAECFPTTYLHSKFLGQKQIRWHSKLSRPTRSRVFSIAFRRQE